MMESVRTSETSVYSNETTWHYIPEDCNNHTRRHWNLNSHKKDFFMEEMLKLQRKEITTFLS
jgi:ribosomal protein L28